jgi:CBS domain-containing protein
MSESTCPSCGFDNIPGADTCEQCMTSLTHEDIPPEEARDAVEKSLLGDTVAELRRARPVTIGTGESLKKVVATMRDARVGCLLVTATDGALVGIITERDLLTKVAGRIEDLSAHAVSEFMTAQPETLEEHRSLGYALHRMMVGDLRHLPLVDEAGVPVGIISSRDIVGRIAELLGAV